MIVLGTKSFFNEMLKYRIFVIAAILLFSTPGTTQITAEKTYQTYCAGCHGKNLEGGLATPLVKTTWLYGREPGYIKRSITHGLPGTEMLAWKNVLSSDEISDLVDYIIELQDMPVTADREIPTKIVSELYTIDVEQVVPEGLEYPWAIEFIDNETMLISEIDGRLRFCKKGKLSEPISGTPQPYRAYGNGGLMDIALDPEFKNNGWVYLAFHYSSGDPYDKNAPRTINIVRGKVENNKWVNEETIFEVPEDLRIQQGSGRQGSRMVIDGDKKLYFTIGDMGYEDQCQELSSILGKSFRINLDGSIPKDNPFVNEPGAIPQIFTLGNRNIQGISIHPVSKKIYATEHGPMGGDELNILESGNNYGWPKVSFGIGYDGAKYTDLTEMEGMINPVKQWTPSIAICPIEFSAGSMFHKWENNLIAGALAYEELNRLVLKDDKFVSTEQLLKGYGRVRDVKFAPDGSLYVVLNRPDKILRLTPVE